MQKRTVFIVDYAHGFNAATCEPNYVSRLRSKAALRALKKYPNALIVLGAGMNDVTEGCGSLAQMMQSFLVGEGVPRTSMLVRAKGHDTLSETVAAHTAIRKHTPHIEKIVCATSYFHAPRVWLIWLLRFGIMPEIVTTSLRPHFFEQVIELGKIPRDITRSLFGRWNAKRAN